MTNVKITNHINYLTDVRENEIYDENVGEWRKVIRMTKKIFNEEAKTAFLQEYRKHGRFGDSCRAIGFSLQAVRHGMEIDDEFALAVKNTLDEYKDKLIGHHQNLVFNGQKKRTYDRVGNLISEETIYPIRLIELELKKHDAGYRDKQEITANVTGGVMIAPAEAKSVEDWEKRFSKAKDITPVEDAQIVEKDPK